MTHSFKLADLSDLFRVVLFTGAREGKWPAPHFVRLNAVLGLCGEAGEVSDALRYRDVEGAVEENRAARLHLVSELADVLWYFAYYYLADSGPANADFVQCAMAQSLTERLDAACAYELLMLQKVEAKHGILCLFEGTSRAADELKKNLCHERPLRPHIMDSALRMALSGMAEILVARNISVEECVQQSVIKQRARYPNGFSVAAAAQRADEQPPLTLNVFSE